MALKVGDRVRENTSSTGVGGLSLTGSPAGFQRFSAVLASGDTTYYTIEENDKFEVGIGVYGSDNLERTTVLASSNSGDKISLGGSGVVFITYPASKALFNNENDQFVLGASGIQFASGNSLIDPKIVELTDVNLSGTPSQSTVLDLNITNKSLSLGDMSGATNTNNVLIGYGAASGITTAQHNVVVGSESSGMNKTGSRNVYVGSNSGPTSSSASTSAYESVAIGCDAGHLVRQQSTVVGYSAGASSYEAGFTAVGYKAGENVGSYSTTIGYQAGTSLSEDYSVCLGFRAGYNGAGDSSVWIGRGAGTSSSSSTNTIGIGRDAGKSSSATESIYIGESAGESNSVDNLIFIGNASPSSNGTLIKGDMSNKRVAVGAADVTLDDTFFVGISSQNDEGIVVKGAVSQSSNLTSWKNSSDSTMASVDPNGVISANAIHATGNGIQIDSSTPAATSSKLYAIGTDLYWNGSAISTQVTSSDIDYVSGIAVYSSGQTIQNKSDINYVSGVAAAAGGGDVSTDQLNYVSGIAVYASGIGPPRTYNNITADFTMTDSSDVVFFDTSSNAININLPTAVGKGGQELLFKFKDGPNSGVLIGNGSETIDGDSVYPMYHKNQSISLISDNSNWYVT
jgi:hypothetical protein